MIGEYDIGGVFAPGYLIFAAAALLISFPVRRLIDRLGLYRLVWHRGLFDLAILILLWSGVCALAAAFTFPA